MHFSKVAGALALGLLSSFSLVGAEPRVPANSLRGRFVGSGANIAAAHVRAVEWIPQLSPRNPLSEALTFDARADKADKAKAKKKAAATKAASSNAAASTGNTTKKAKDKGAGAGAVASNSTAAAGSSTAIASNSTATASNTTNPDAGTVTSLNSTSSAGSASSSSAASGKGKGEGNANANANANGNNNNANANANAVNPLAALLTTLEGELEGELGIRSAGTGAAALPVAALPIKREVKREATAND